MLSVRLLLQQRWELCDGRGSKPKAQHKFGFLDSVRNVHSDVHKWHRRNNYGSLVRYTCHVRDSRFFSD